MGRATFGPGSRTVTTCSPRWPIAWKAAGAGAPDVLGEIRPVHGTTDPPLRQEAGGQQGVIAKEGVIEIAVARGQVLLGLVGQEQGDVAAGSEGGERGDR